MPEERLFHILRVSGNDIEVIDQLHDHFVASLSPGSPEQTTVQSLQIPPGSDEGSGMQSLIARDRFDEVHILGIDHPNLGAIVAASVEQSSDLPVALVVDESNVETVVAHVGELVPRIGREVHVVLIETR